MIKRVPWEQRNQGWYSRYFLVPNRVPGEWRAILDLRLFMNALWLQVGSGDIYKMSGSSSGAIAQDLFSTSATC